MEVAAAYGREDSEPIGAAATGPDIAVFFVAYRDNHPVGCGGLRFIGNGVGEVKRMYVEPASRGTGVSTAILKALESWAVERSVRTLRLKTGDLLVAGDEAGDEGVLRETAVDHDGSVTTPELDHDVLLHNSAATDAAR